MTNPDITEPNTSEPDDNRARSLGPGIVTGFGAVALMWLAWLGTHAPAVLQGSGSGGTASPTLTAVAVGAALIVGVAWWTRRARGPGWKIGLIAGAVSGITNLLLLGSLLGEQVGSTDQMGEAANRLRDDWATILFGFLGVSLVAGTLAGWLGGLLRGGDGDQDRGHWVARLGLIVVVMVAPLIVIGGAVTGTDSGLAVPDGLTSYGSVSVLFPISLMSEPRIFLEHTHRLFGTLVGFVAIALMIYTAIAHPRGRWIGIGVGLVFLIAAAGLVVAGRSEALSSGLAVGLMSAVGIGALGFTHAMLSRRKLSPAASGLLAVITIQGLFGMARVDEQLAWVGLFHGVFAQIVLVTAAMLAVALTPLYASLGDGVLPETRTRARRTFRFGIAGLTVLAIQLTFGAMIRHVGGAHVTISHMVNSFLVVGLVLLMAVLLLSVDAQTRPGRTLRRCGSWLLGLLGVQFVLGWLALMSVGLGQNPRDVPTSEELGGAPPIELGEALITTAHQTCGAALLAVAAVSATWARRVGRAD